MKLCWYISSGSGSSWWCTYQSMWCCLV